MDFLREIILLIIVVLLLLCVYRINDLNSKLRRIRGRYDKLLRGRGELNLEELLASQARDIEVTKKVVEEISIQNEALNKDINSKSNSLSKQFEGNISEVDNRLSSAFESFNIELRSRMTKLERIQKEDLEDVNRKLDQNFKDIFANMETKYDDFTKEANRTIKFISDQMAFTVQKVALKRYNALSNQSGELSFTIVLLNQFNTGVMLTCINGRDSSYTYSKNITNGKAETEMSVQEIQALQEALNIRG